MNNALLNNLTIEELTMLWETGDLSDEGKGVLLMKQFKYIEQLESDIDYGDVSE